MGRGGGWLSQRLRGLVGGLSLLSLSLPGVAAAGSDFDLLGTWYVLIHYKDAAADNPLADRWDDKVWVFGKKGSRLSWSEYSTVVFSDSQGRFERTMSGAESRVLAAWQPSDSQLREIQTGLEVKSIGSKTKTLRGSPRKGYKSVGSLRTQSVSVIGFHETWSIEGLPDAPVFTRDDLMGSGRTSKLEGRTQYRASEVLDGGAEIRGSFERDGTRHGVFRMLRSGEVVKGRSRKKKETKRPYLTVFDHPSDKKQIAALASKGDALSDAEREELRERLAKSVGATLRGAGLEGAALAQRSESLSSQVEGLLLEQGKTVDEIEAMVREGKIRP